MFTHKNCPISPIVLHRPKSRTIIRIELSEGSKIIFFSTLNHHYVNGHLFCPEPKRVSYTHIHTRMCAVVHHGRCLSPSAPEEFNRKSIKVTRQLVVARLCTGAIVKAKPVILYIRQREPTPNQYPLWYTDVYRKRSATTAGIICDPGFVARATIEISLFNIILSARVWCLWIGGRSWNRHFGISSSLIYYLRSDHFASTQVGKNFRWKFLLFRFYFFFKFINFHGQHRLNNVRFVPSVWNRVKYSSSLREKNC